MHTEIKTYVKHWKRHLDSMDKASQLLIKKALDDASKIPVYLRERHGINSMDLERVYGKGRMLRNMLIV